MKTILAVDDSLDILKMIKMLLESQGYRVITATDGKDALSKVVEHKFDLIILDVMMPEVSGYEVSQSLKDNPNFKSIPILLLTARLDEIDPAIRKEMGIEYMAKPYNDQAFLSKIYDMIGKA
jgi:two-component system, sensor histidine kinase and response regulator